MLPDQPSNVLLHARWSKDASKPTLGNNKVRTWAGVFFGPCGVEAPAHKELPIEAAL